MCTNRNWGKSFTWFQDLRKLTLDVQSNKGKSFSCLGDWKTFFTSNAKILKARAILLVQVLQWLKTSLIKFLNEINCFDKSNCTHGIKPWRCEFFKTQTILSYSVHSYKRQDILRYNEVTQSGGHNFKEKVIWKAVKKRKEKKRRDHHQFYKLQSFPPRAIQENKKGLYTPAWDSSPAQMSYLVDGDRHPIPRNSVVASAAFSAV